MQAMYISKSRFTLKIQQVLGTGSQLPKGPLCDLEYLKDELHFDASV